jgi:hypothetical protein
VRLRVYDARMADFPETFEPGLQRAFAHLQATLIPGETLEAIAVQRRAYALRHRRLLIGATTGRLICIERGLLGGYRVIDRRWQDLEGVHLNVGVLAADLSVQVGASTDLALEGSGAAQRLEFTGLRKEGAQAVYRICQAQDQAWREKRRVRELEEMRARSGGMQLNTAAAQGGGGDAVARLQQAKALLEARLISDSEYESIKAKIVSP